MLSLSLAILLWLLNYIAIQFYFYWTIAWYDIMMHFLGGLTIGVFLIYLLKIFSLSTRSFLTIFILAMAISIAWEIFEYINDLNPIEGYMTDTLLDFLMDALGIFVAYLTVSRIFLKVSG